VLWAREQHVRETEELLAAGRKLSAVLESLPVGILIADIDGRICQTNDEVARICKASSAIDVSGYSEIIRRWISEGDALKGSDGPLARALHAGTTSHNERLDIRCSDGSSKQLLVSVSPLLGIGGEIVGAVIVIKDTTTTQQIELELETRVARLVSLGVEIEQSMHP
jgi:PAS domain-containing protein